MERPLTSIQSHIQDQGLDGWLLYSYEGGNSIFNRVTGLSEGTGRCFLWIPASGEAKLLLRAMDAPAFRGFSAQRTLFLGWQEIGAWLATVVKPGMRVAMEYSPEGALAGIAKVDAGTVELVRSFGPEIVSSGDLYQAACCALDPEEYASHLKAAAALDEIKDLAFSAVRKAVQAGSPLNEYDIQQLILAEFDKRDLVTEDGEPIVAVNEHSRLPHYMPAPEGSAAITKDCWLLIDIWAKAKGPRDVFADITWVAYTGPNVPEKQQEMFAITCEARDRAFAVIEKAWKEGRSAQGFEADRAARDYIAEKGYGETFIHTTGHSLGTSVHAPGVGLNDLSAHDTRRILPGACVTIEPGIYLHDFGMRTEIDVYVDPVTGPVITTSLQKEIPLLF